METIHVLILILTMGVVLIADHAGFNYFRGKKQTLEPKFLNRLHLLTWTGLLGMIVSGLFLVLPGLNYYLSLPAFRIKMFFVLVLIINSLAIDRMAKWAVHTPYAQLSKEQKRVMVASASASAIGWIGAIIMGAIFL